MGDHRRRAGSRSSSRCTSSATAGKQTARRRRRRRPGAATDHRKQRVASSQPRPTAPAKPTTVKLQLVPTGTVYVCLVDGTGNKLIPGQIFNERPDDPDEDRVEDAADARQRVGADEGQRRAASRSTPSASSIGFLLQPSGTHAAARLQAAALRMSAATAAGRDPDHRHRGPDRDHLRPQRPVAVRAAARDRRRRGDDRDRRRPARGPARGARVHGARGDGADRHQRRPRADRRRPHRRDRRPLRADARWCSTRASRSGSRRSCAPMMQPLARPRRRRDPCLEPQAGGDPRGRDRARPGRDRAGARRAAGRAARARRSSCCRARRASFSRCGRRRVATDAFRAAIAGAPVYAARDRPAVRDPGVGDREHAARGRGRTGSRSTRSRSRPACAAARSRSRRATSRPPRPAYDAFVEFIATRHADTLFSRDGSTIDEQVVGAAGRAHGRGRRVVHGRADGGAADRPARVLGVLRRRRRRLLERGQGRSSSASTRR